MNFFYNGFALHNLGEITVSLAREYDDRQRIKGTLKVGVAIFRRSYADNYSLVQGLKAALLVQRAAAQWQNPDNNTDYLNQVVQVVSDDLPDEWGEFQMQFNLVFSFHEQNLVTNNLPMTFTPNSIGDAVESVPTVVLGNVTKFSPARTTERYSPHHSHRSITHGKVNFAGYLLVDATLSLDAQRSVLIAAQVQLDAAMNTPEGTLQFGQDGAVFNKVVRIEDFHCEVDQLDQSVTWSFTAGYTAYPDDTSFAMIEYQADERESLEPATGETFLTLSGKITTPDEASARTALTALLATALVQYGYATGQLLKDDTTAHNVEADADGAAFIELNFSQEYRGWRTDNVTATFRKTGQTHAPVSLGNVTGWDFTYSGRRFNELRSQRREAGGTISAAGTWVGDASLTVAARRTQLLAMQQAMADEVNGADGTLARGAFSQVGRIENFKAVINQALTGINWTFTFIWSLFPNESGYATTEFSISQAADVESGEQTLSFSGTIFAPDEALARAQLASVRTTMLGTYGFTLAQQLRPQSTVRNVYANGDKTAGLASVEGTDGTTFIELTFSEEYRQRMANLVGFKARKEVKQDVSTGLVMTSYTGTVTASGANVGAAYAAALVVAVAQGAGKEAELGQQGFLRSSQISYEIRQTQASNVMEFVTLTFAYEYQGKLATGSSYLEVNTDHTADSFGSDSVNVSGYVVAVDGPTASALYQSQVRASYAGMLIRGERLAEGQVMKESTGTFTTQDLRLDFSFTAFVAKAAGVVNYRYSVSVSNDYLQLERKSQVRGSVFAADATTAAAAVATLLGGLSLGVLVADDSAEDHEYTSASTVNAFIKYDFGAAYTNKITGIANLLEMQVTENIKYSGVRWIVQPIPRAADGTGGVSIPQDAGIEPGSRTVRGSVTTAVKQAGVEWARQQRALLTGDANKNNFPQPEELDVDYAFVPRRDGVILGTGANVKLFRVNFGFSEILPLYPPTA